jgi:Leucine-rich repeat (LRR) protein
MIGFTLLTVLLSACTDYRFTVNEKVLYIPEQPFNADSIADESLRDCVQQTIRDQGITAASQLEELNCSHAGITDLVGLEVFSGLIRLKLSSNNIDRLTPLFELARLSELQIDGNQLVSLGAIYQLPSLSYLNVAGNDALACQELENLAQRAAIKIDAPEHC